MARSDLTSDIDLGEYGQVLWRRKGIIVVTVLIVTVAAVALSLVQPKVYEASAEVRLQTPDASSSAPADPTRADLTEVQVIKSEPVRLDAARRLGVTQPPNVSVTPVAGSDIVNVKSKSRDAVKAAAASNALTSAYLALRRQQALDGLTAATSRLQAQIDAIGKQIQALPAAGAGKASEPAVQSLVDQQTLFQQRLDQLQVDAALPTEGAQVVAAATAPSAPISPKPVRNVALALITALVLGVGLAMLSEVLDDAVRTSDDLARASYNMPLLGLVPRIEKLGSLGDHDGLLQTDLNSPAGEAYRSVRTSLQLLSPDHPAGTILVTSPLGAEGKTTTTANLGLAFARAGQRVLLVDCDLRRPRLHELFGLDNKVGLISVLAGDATVTDALQLIPGEPNMLFLASGPLPPAPPELLASKRTGELLKELAKQSDVVLLDSPPLLPVTDAVLLSRIADTTVLVINAGMTTRRQTQRSIDLICQANPAPLGAVLNRVATDMGQRYTYTHYANIPATTKDVASHAKVAGSGRRRNEIRNRSSSLGPRRSPSIDDESPVG